jgi:hypothetical protein
MNNKSNRGEEWRKENRPEDGQLVEVGIATGSAADSPVYSA